MSDVSDFIFGLLKFVNIDAVFFTAAGLDILLFFYFAVYVKKAKKTVIIKKLALTLSVVNLSAFIALLIISDKIYRAPSLTAILAAFQGILLLIAAYTAKRSKKNKGCDVKTLNGILDNAQKERECNENAANSDPAFDRFITKIRCGIENSDEKMLLKTALMLSNERDGDGYTDAQKKIINDELCKILKTVK